MPEGHVSHRNAIRLGGALGGRLLTLVEAPEPRIAGQRIPERLAGDRVSGAEAVGKHHLLRFDSGRVLHSHLMMSGVWRLRRAGGPVSRAGLFLALHTDEHVAALYRCPHVRLLEPGEPLPAAVRRVGPDLLDEAVDPASATAAALARTDPTRQVGDALMDQRIVGGIGNVYKSETCFLAGVDPWRAVGSLSPEEAAALGATAARLLAAGVAEGGAIRTFTPPPGARPVRPGGGRTTWVYRRRGLPCRRCGTPIRSRGQSDDNRTTYWCASCQT